MAANYTIGPFRLDAKAHILFHGADPVLLGQRAVALLCALAERPGVPVSKNELIEAVWSGVTVEESNLTVQIAALRRVFGKEAGGERWIETLPRRGYRFIGPVAPIDHGAVAVAASSLAGQESAAVHDSAATQPEPVSPMPRAEPELRQLTVMSCALVGPPARADPEDLRDAIRAYQRCVADTVVRYGGSVGKHVGSTVLTYFGYPTAHEHDTEQAVRAGLDLCAVIRALVPAAGFPLRCRIGIATGLVIIGDQLVTGGTQERGMVGEAPNMASRLQAIANPDTVVVEGAARRLIGNLFHCRALGSIEGNQPAEPIPVWRVLGPSGVQSRFEAFHATHLTPLVGREEELELLQRRWNQAKQGEGRVVLISGEPGIGKSRIALALQDAVQDEPHIKLRYFCSPHHANSALYPFISQLEQVLQFARDATPAEKFARLETILTPSTARIEHAQALFADLLSLPANDDHPLPEETPEKRKDQIFAILLAQLAGLCAQHPVLMVFEDVHWLDPTSRELLTLVIARAPSLPLCVIVTFRPEFAPPWIGEAHVSMMLLGRLGLRQRATLVQHIAGNKALPSRIVDEIVSRTDGVPLFLEELTKVVLETGAAEAEAETSASAVPSTAFAVPASLQASLTARLDHVGRAKEIAQTGAAIGREFSYELLAAVSGRDDNELRSGLARLTETGLLFCRGTLPNATYQFKHALVQDAAYGMLLKDRRQQLHADIAAALEAHVAAWAQAHPEVVAYHYTKAGLAARAIDRWLTAGQLANGHSASEEAVAHLTNGLDLLGTVSDQQERDRLELKFQSALAPALIATKGAGAQEALNTYARARMLMRVTQEYSAQAGVLAGLYAVYVTRAEYENALDVAEECLKSAEQRAVSTDLCVANRLVAVSHTFAGNFSAAHRYAEQAWAHYDQARDGPFAWRYSRDIGVGAGSFLSIALAHLGRFEQSRTLTRTLLELAQRLGHQNTIAYAHCCAAALPAYFMRDFPRLRHHAGEMQVFGRQHHLPTWVFWGASLEAPALAAAGELSQAFDQIENGLRLRERLNNRCTARLFHTGNAEVLLCAGHNDKALDLIGKLLDPSEEGFERWTNAELWRLKGAALLAAQGRSAVPEAEACYRQAMAVAESQGSRMIYLRAATDLARLMAERAEYDRARALLEPIFTTFTEGFDAPDLTDAKSLLDALH